MWKWLHSVCIMKKLQNKNSDLCFTPANKCFKNVFLFSTEEEFLLSSLVCWAWVGLKPWKYPWVAFCWTLQDISPIQWEWLNDSWSPYMIDWVTGLQEHHGLHWETGESLKRLLTQLAGKKPASSPEPSHENNILEESKHTEVSENSFNPRVSAYLQNKLPLCVSKGQHFTNFTTCYNKILEQIVQNVKNRRVLFLFLKLKERKQI